MDNAKIFSQPMSKSRSLAKVSERRVQPVAYAGGAPKRAPPLRPSLIQLQACVAQVLLEKSYLHVEKFLRAISACRAGGTVPCPPLAQ